MGRIVWSTVFAVLLLAAPAQAQFPHGVCTSAKINVRPDEPRTLTPCGWNTRVEITRAPQHGQLTPQVRPYAAMRYVPHPGYKGPDSFAFRRAGSPASEPDSEMTISVTTENGAPYCTPATLTVTSGGAFPAACADPDEGDSLRMIITQPPATGRASVFMGGVSYMAGPPGTDHMIVQADDGKLTSAPARLDLVIKAPGAPQCEDTTLTVRKNAARYLEIRCQENGSPVPSFFMNLDFIGGLDHGGLLRGAMGNTRYAPDDGFTGTDTFTGTYSANGHATDPFTLTFNVTEQGNKPFCTPLEGRLQVRAGRTVETGVFCQDADRDPLELSVPEKPYRGGLAASTWGQFVYTADAGYSGPDRFGVRAFDGYVNSDVLRQNIHVLPADANSAPWCESSPAGEMMGGGSAVGLRCLDAEGDPLTYTLGTPAHGTVQLTDGWFGKQVSYTAAEGFSGEDRFTYQASDAAGAKSAVMTARVFTAPPATPRKPECWPQATRKMRPNGSISIYASCMDPNTGSPAAMSLVGEPSNGTLSSFSPMDYTYTPNADFTGQDQVTLRATNSTGTTDVVITIDVDPAANHVPYCGIGREVTTRTAVDIATDCYDPDQDALTRTITVEPAHGDLTGDPGSGTITYTPDAGFTGTDSFTIKVDDGHGGIVTGKRTIRVRADDVNVRPACEGNVSGGAMPGQPITIYHACQDADGDPVTFEVVTPPANGTIEQTGYGGFQYTPNPGFVGPDSVTIVADDGRAKSLPATFGLESRDWNQLPAPTCRSLVANVRPNQARPITLSCPWAIGPVTIETVVEPDHGTLSPPDANGVVTYTPDPNHQGPDAFTYRGKSGDVAGQPVTVTLNVEPAPALPSDVVLERPIGPDPPGSAQPEDPKAEEPTKTEDPKTETEAPAATPAPPATVTPPLLTPSLRDVALQAMGVALRSVAADLGGAQAFLPALPPKVGTKLTKLLAVACAQPCGVRVKAKLVNGRRSVKLPAGSAALGRNRAHAFAYRVSGAHRRALGRPKRAILVLDVKVRDAAGKTHREQIRVRLTLR